MKKIYLVLLLITSLLLTQCYTQYEYLTKDYSFNTEDDLKKVVLNDGTVKEFAENQYSYKIKSDSLILMLRAGEEKWGEHTRIRIISETLKADDIHSIFVSELNIGPTVGISFLGLGIVLWVSTWDFLPGSANFFN